MQITRPSNYFPAPGRGGLRPSNRPGRGYGNFGDRGATANGPSQRGDENSDPHSDDDDSSQEEPSAFSQEEDNDEDDKEEREEDKATETPITVTTQNNVTRGRYRGRGGGQRGRFRGRGYRNTGNSNARYRGNYRGPQGRNPRQSYPSSNNVRSSQSDKKTERAEDTTVEPSQVDNHEETFEEEVSQSISTPKDQRPPRERRTVPQHSSNSSPTSEQQQDTPPIKDQPTSVDEAD